MSRHVCGGDPMSITGSIYGHLRFFVLFSKQIFIINPFSVICMPAMPLVLVNHLMYARTLRKDTFQQKQTDKKKILKRY